ncbi:MAG: hypothetical protein IKZ82_10835 [Clostridia bacterium]|nr:hypothetical protein [Clostridia bacterium]
MSEARIIKCRPRILENDTYAASVCPAIYAAATAALTDAEAFREELFAATATEAGYPYWADALGLKIDYLVATSIRRIGLRWYLQRGGTFNMAYLRELVSGYAGSSEITFAEDVNQLTITIPSSMPAEQFERMRKSIEAQKPMHLTVIYAGSISL